MRLCMSELLVCTSVCGDKDYMCPMCEVRVPLFVRWLEIGTCTCLALIVLQNSTHNHWAASVG